MASFETPPELTFDFISELVKSSLGTVNGEDTEGKEYGSVKEMWDFELGVGGSKRKQAAETQLNKARNAQRVRQELFAACKQPALPTGTTCWPAVRRLRSLPPKTV